jgi:hypothetical protein
MPSPSKWWLGVSLHYPRELVLGSVVKANQKSTQKAIHLNTELTLQLATVRLTSGR